MKQAIVLGAGMVGRVMAADLAADADVTVRVADVDPAALALAAQGGDIETVVADLSDPAVIRGLGETADVVLGALPSRLGLAALAAVIESGRPYCDISFMPEDALALDDAAKAAGVTAVVDCGVAPGMSNMLAAAGVAALDVATEVEIYVGGLPHERRWPFEYKAAFAPGDVIEEYTRPARLVEHGRVVVREALTEPELIEFDGVGTLEAFNTDGLRTLIDTLDVPHMKEKTLRYPGHIELMRALRATGLFSEEPVDVKGQSVRPRDLIAALMFPHWSYEEGETDLTVMRVEVRGRRDGRPASCRWDLLDHYDVANGRTSMSRTTAFPCAIVARLLMEGRIEAKGVIPPEILGRDEALLAHVLAELERRDVRYRASEGPEPL